MSSCLTGGGGRSAYGLESLNLNCIKSPSSSSAEATSWASNSSSSPSSTLSEEHRNLPLAIFTRKPRTPRKRPNQTYDEAAAILSTAYPRIFQTAKHLTKPSQSKLNKAQENTQNDGSKGPLLFESSSLLMPFHVFNDDLGFLLNQPVLERPHFERGSNPSEKSCLIVSVGQHLWETCDDFDAESTMLSEENGEGIDSVIGKNIMVDYIDNNSTIQVGNSVYGYPVGLGFDHHYYYYGMKREFRAMRTVDEGDDWWKFPGVTVPDLNTNIHKTTAKKKKKVENEKSIAESVAKEEVSTSNVKAKSGEPALMLKLDHDAVLNAWTDKAPPFNGNDVHISYNNPSNYSLY